MLSRYNKYSTNTTINGVNVVNGLASTEFRYIGPIIIHTVVSGETLMTLSYKYLMKIDYWWVIAWHNNIIDPIEGLISGDVIEIPTDMSLLDDIMRAGI